MATIFSGTFAANGSTAVFKIRPAGRNSDLTPITVTGQGTFDSGTLALQFSLDGSTWTTVASLTVAGQFNHLTATSPDVSYRLNLASSTSPDLDYVVADCR